MTNITILASVNKEMFISRQWSDWINANASNNLYSQTKITLGNQTYLSEISPLQSTEQYPKSTFQMLVICDLTYTVQKQILIKLCTGASQ